MSAYKKVPFEVGEIQIGDNNLSITTEDLAILVDALSYMIERHEELIQEDVDFDLRKKRHLRLVVARQLRDFMDG